jgi:hypothetical protein
MNSPTRKQKIDPMLVAAIKCFLGLIDSADEAREIKKSEEIADQPTKRCQVLLMNFDRYICNCRYQTA